jgi:NADH dehydrogenase
LAAACRARGLRLVHVSALGLYPQAASRFIRSKIWGESAVAAAGGDYVIVRPSLLDGDDGFGARWLRRVARWPVQLVPANAVGRIAALHVDDLADAIAALCDPTTRLPWKEAELGGPIARPLPAYLGALRASAGLPATRALKVPGWLARPGAHLMDLLHLSPFSFGHYELLRRDNVPADNRLNFLLGRAPTPLGERMPPELSLPARPPRLPGLRDAAGPAS